MGSKAGRERAGEGARARARNRECARATCPTEELQMPRESARARARERNFVVVNHDAQGGTARYKAHSANTRAASRERTQERAHAEAGIADAGLGDEHGRRRPAGARVERGRKFFFDFIRKQCPQQRRHPRLSVSFLYISLPP